MRPAPQRPCPPPTRRRLLPRAAALLLVAMTVVGATDCRAATRPGPVRPPSVSASTTTTTDEPGRPLAHFTPARNWMNDPNGLVHLDGEYHLFYQHNPHGNDWGNMSWGHAVSTDQVHWQELPVAITGETQDIGIFSGSAVVDHANTSGLGRPGTPAMVAIYTRAELSTGRQAQSLAFSLDKGRTWTKVDGGAPVLDIGSKEFRDPKVTWDPERRSWLMVVAHAADRTIGFYRSPDLRRWTHLSDFGPAGATGGVWECPDLFPLPLDADPARRRWVLIVSLNPGAVAGGSGTQYFVGSFDGTTFVADPAPAEPTLGTPRWGFDGGGFDGWTATGTAFGYGSVDGALSGQMAVSGSDGRYVSSFHGLDRSTGTLTSPPFTARKPYLAFRIAGGRKPWTAGSSSTAADPAGRVVADVEGDSYAGWEVTGSAFGDRPATGTIGDQQTVSGWHGARLANSFGNADRALGDGDAATGRALSGPFTIDDRHLSFLIGGGRHSFAAADPVGVALVVDGRRVRTATGADSETMDWRSWDVSDLKGREARIELVDEATGRWGHVLADRFVLGPSAATPRDHHVGVDLLVDGQVVQSVTGGESEQLDVAHLDLRTYQGRTVQVRLTDLSPDSWGHVLADSFVESDVAPTASIARARWLDHGTDLYAAVSWNDEPAGVRTLVGWMTNWEYAGLIPTSPWRGSMSLPRRVELRTVDGRPTLVSSPVPALGSLRSGDVVTVGPRSIMTGRTPIDLGTAAGTATDLDVVLEPGSAERSGIEVQIGVGEATRIGYDRVRGELVVDRSRSGVADLTGSFGQPQRVAVPLVGGRVRLRVVVDAGSVEVFARGGAVTVTTQTVPSAGATGVGTFAEGGSARLVSLTAARLASYRS